MRTKKTESIVVSALTVRTGFGKLLRRVEDEHRSFVIEKRGMPKAVLLSIRDYVRLAAPEPEVLKVIGEESRRKRTDNVTSRQIDQVIKATRAEKSKRGYSASAGYRHKHPCLGRIKAGRTSADRSAAGHHQTS
jgi:prevent-host-death family protein